MYKRSSVLEQQFRFFPHAQCVNFKTQTKNSALLSHTPFTRKGHSTKNSFRLANKPKLTEITATLRVIYKYLYWQFYFHLGMTKKENTHAWEVIFSKLLWRKISFFHCQEPLCAFAVKGLLQQYRMAINPTVYILRENRYLPGPGACHSQWQCPPWSGRRIWTTWRAPSPGNLPSCFAWHQGEQ